jgi:predicted ArsR family transcriptional regulator
VNEAWCTSRPRVRPPDERAVEHAALASAARLRLLDLLVASPSPVHLDDLVAETGLHGSTVRGHLNVLAGAGFIESGTDHRGRPGRPQAVYRPTAMARGGTAGCHGYRTLAYVLSAFLHQEAVEPDATGERAGRAWGARLTRDEPVRRLSADETVERLREILESIGFAPSVVAGEEGPGLLERTCPFAGVVVEHAPIACGVHRGLVLGILDGIGVSLELAGMTTGIPERACRVRLRPRTSEL